LPPKAQQDLVEWEGSQDVVGYLDQVVSHGTQLTNVLNPALDYRITDDRPFNEYYLLRLAHFYAP
jgi:hypothetical protein